MSEAAVTVVGSIKVLLLVSLSGVLLVTVPVLLQTAAVGRMIFTSRVALAAFARLPIWQVSVRAIPLSTQPTAGTTLTKVAPAG